MDERAPVLVAAGLTRRHRGGHGVEGIDLELRAGEVLSVVGPNGAGKTTLLRALATADPIQGGGVAWFGSRDRRAPGVRRRLGIALDRTAHFEELTGYQNAWLLAHRYGLDDGATRIRLGRLLAWAGLGEAVHRPVREYSLGMRRRLALVEALVHRPELLLLDEPTLGLDWVGTLGLVGELRRGRAGRATLLATNDVHLVERLGGRVAFLHEGRIVRQGSVDELLAELGGLQEMELQVRTPIALAPLLRAPGVRGGAAEGATVRLLLTAEANPAGVLSALNGEGDLVSGMRIRRPDLGDAFAHLTGASLAAGEGR